MSWERRKVLVTGADGFIGSHLAEALVEAGAEVRALCYYNVRNSVGWLDYTAPEIAAEIDFRLGDVRDARFMERSCEGVEYVFHLAALIAIPYSYVAPESYVDTNVRGTLNLLEAARRHGCERIVQTSTSEVYGTPESLPITEAHPLRAQSPYAATKIAADKLCEAYYCSFGTPVVTLRPFNTYGPRQSARAVIPTILTQLLRGEPEIELGNLEPKRDLTFVADTVRGFLAAGLVEGLEGRTIQLGTGRSESIRDIVDAAQRACGTSTPVRVARQRMRPEGSEVMTLLADASLAERLLDWRPTVSLETGLELTADWMRENLHHYRGRGYVI